MLAHSQFKNKKFITKKLQTILNHRLLNCT